MLCPNITKGMNYMANTYDYRQAMYDDIKEYIEDEVDLSEYSSQDELYDALNDDLWVADSVTGNASGSYTFNAYKAKEYILGDSNALDYLKDMCDEFGTDAATIGEKFLNEDWEWFDVSIRCYLLGQVLGEVLDDMDLEFGTDEDEEDEEE